MSYQKTVAAPIVVDGMEFPRLTRKELGAILAQWVDADRGDLKRVLDDASATPEQRLKELKDFERSSRGIGYAWETLALRDFDRVEETLLASVLKKNPGLTEVDVDALKLERNQRYEIAAELWGIDLKIDMRFVAIRQAWSALPESVRDAAWSVVKDGGKKAKSDEPDPTTQAQTTA